MLLIVRNAESDEILASYLSPPIFVDSRLEARGKVETSLIGAQESGNSSSTKGLFHPSSLAKQFLKKTNPKGGKHRETVLIENSIKGLFDYFTAPNIKKRESCLLFLALRFYKALQVFFPANFLATADVIYWMMIRKCPYFRIFMMDA